MSTIRTTKQIPLTDIQPHPDNPNHGDAGAISLSLQHHGQYRAIVVSEATGNIVAGNHTYLAAKMNGAKTMLAHLIPDLTPEDEVRIMVADNQYAKLAYTDDDVLADLLKDLAASDDGLLATGWDGDLLDELLNDLWPTSTFERGEDGKYTRKVESPIYEPSGPTPTTTALIDRSYTSDLRDEIEAANLPEDIAQFLLYAAERHTVFHFDQIANYYAYAPTDIQKLMEASALVIVDFDQAIEYGFVKLNEDTEALFKSEHPDA